MGATWQNTTHEQTRKVCSTSTLISPSCEEHSGIQVFFSYPVHGELGIVWKTTSFAPPDKLLNMQPPFTRTHKHTEVYLCKGISVSCLAESREVIPLSLPLNTLAVSKIPHWLALGVIARKLGLTSVSRHSNSEKISVSYWLRLTKRHIEKRRQRVTSGPHACLLLFFGDKWPRNLMSMYANLAYID